MVVFRLPSYMQNRVHNQKKLDKEALKLCLSKNQEVVPATLKTCSYQVLGWTFKCILNFELRMAGKPQQHITLLKQLIEA